MLLCGVDLINGQVITINHRQAQLYRLPNSRIYPAKLHKEHAKLNSFANCFIHLRINSANCRGFSGEDVGTMIVLIVVFVGLSFDSLDVLIVAKMKHKKNYSVPSEIKSGSQLKFERKRRRGGGFDLFFN